MPKFYKNEIQDDMSDYYAISDTPDENNMRPYGYVRVIEDKREIVPTWSTEDPHITEPARYLSQLTGVHHDLINDMRYHHSSSESRRAIRDALWAPTPDNLKNAITHINNHPAVQSGKLFHDEPSSLTVEGAYFNKNARTLLPLTLSIVKNDYPNHTLIASSDLSSHSSQIVKNAVSRGLIQPSPENPTAEVTNDIDFDDMLADEYTGYGYTPISDRKVSSARQNLRSMLQKERVSKLSPQFKKDDEIQPFQPKLPGLENY